MFQNSDRKRVPGKGTKNAKTLQGLRPATFGAPVAMALYNQGSGIPVIQMSRTRPRPQMGRVGARGPGGVQQNKKLVARI
jgi:hypothetical protein